jgi:tetraacyldisaccharide 4'-kinase
MSSLKRAGDLIITRCANLEQFNQASGIMKAHFQAESQSSYKAAEMIGLQTKFKSFKPALTNEKIEAVQFIGKRIMAVSGIGCPKSFESTLSDAGITVIEHFAFSDHHWFSEKDIQMIIKARKTLNADFIITTEKDFVRLKDRYIEFLNTEPVIIAEIQQVLIAGSDRLDTAIKNVTR